MVFNNSILLGSGGQGGAPTFDTTLIGNSIWVDGSGTSGDAMTRTWGTESNQDRWIWATWYSPLREIDAVADRNAIFASGSGSNGFYLRHTSTSSTFNIFCRDNAGNEGAINTSESYRDIGSWYHVLVDFDSANAIANDRISLYVNGVRVGAYSGTDIGQNNHLNTNVSGQTAHICQDSSTTPNYHVQGYLAQTVFLDNKSIANGDLTITDFLDTFPFGTNGSQRIPKSNTDIIALASAAGNNSFCLDYSDSSNIVNDASSKGNNFTPTGGGSPTITSANQSINTPSKTYAVFNPLANADQALPATFTLSEGNQKIAINNSNTSVKMTLPFVMSGSNIIRAQFTFDSVGDIGVGITGSSHTAGTYHTSATSVAGRGEVALFTNAGALGLVIDGNFNNPAFGGSDGLSDGDIVDVFVNCDVGAVYFAVNGTIKGGASQADIQNGVTTNAAQAGGSFVRRTAGEVFNFYAIQVNPSGGTITANTGQSAFTHSYSSITSLKSLSTADLPTPDYQGIDYFDATIYEGNGTGQRVGDFVPVTDVGTITKSFLCDGHTNSGTTDLTIAHTVTTAPTNTQVKTLSFWIKPVSIREQHVYNGSVGASDSTDSSERIYCSHNGEVAYQTRQSGSSVAVAYTAGADINDTAQWYNAVVVLNYDSSTAAADTLKIYVNGVEQALDNSSGGSATLPAPGMTTEAYINKASTRQLIGTHPGFTSANSRSNCYLAEMYMVDGQALDASAFGVLDTSTNRWVPKAPATIKSTITGTGDGFGNCGFYLDFLDASDLGDDDSGNSTPRDFTESATIGTENQVADVPSKNYAVYNTVKGSVYTAMSMSEGNLTTKDGNGSVALAAGFPIQDGYWYYEVNTVEDVNNMVFGLYNPATTVTASTSNPSLSGIQVTGSTLVMQNNGGSNSVAGPTLSNPSAGDVVGIYIRKVENTYGMWFSLNGTAMDNTPAANATATADINFSASIELVPAVHYSNAGTKEAQTNFGQLLQFDGGSTSFDSDSDGNWKHAPVTGFKALNQDNLDDTASKITVWSWIKNRDATDSHILVDRIRGVGKTITSDETSPAIQQTNMDTVNRFLQRGVQIGRDVTVNTANESYVLWQWLAGDSATTGSTTSPAGTIASTTIVADAGHFSVGSYTGNGTDNSTVGHGLGGIPEMIIVRNLSRLTYGLLWHKDGHVDGGTGDPSEFVMDFARAINFAANNEKFGGSDETYPTANVFKIGDHNEINANTESLVFYAFRSVPGVCKVGLYHGNGDADGAYVSVGFRPRWVMIKSNRNARDFVVADTTRFPTNVIGDFLFPSSNAVEGPRGVTSGSDYDLDILSDGFKLRCADGALNDSTSGSSSYMYIAMADIGGNGTLPPIYGR